MVGLKQISDGSTEDIDFKNIQVEVVQLEVKNDHLENSEMLTNYLGNENKSPPQGEGIKCFDFESEKNNKYQYNANLSKAYDDRCDKELEKNERKFDDDNEVKENSKLEFEKIEEEVMFNSFDESFSEGEMTEGSHTKYGISDLNDASKIQNFNIDLMKIEEESDFEEPPIDSNIIKGKSETLCCKVSKKPKKIHIIPTSILNEKSFRDGLKEQQICDEKLIDISNKSANYQASTQNKIELIKEYENKDDGMQIKIFDLGISNDSPASPKYKTHPINDYENKENVDIIDNNKNFKDNKMTTDNDLDYQVNSQGDDVVVQRQQALVMRRTIFDNIVERKEVNIGDKEYVSKVMREVCKLNDTRLSELNPASMVELKNKAGNFAAYIRKRYRQSNISGAKSFRLHYGESWLDVAFDWFPVIELSKTLMPANSIFEPELCNPLSKQKKKMEGESYHEETPIDSNCVKGESVTFDCKVNKKRGKRHIVPTFILFQKSFYDKLKEHKICYENFMNISDRSANFQAPTKNKIEPIESYENKDNVVIIDDNMTGISNVSAHITASTEDKIEQIKEYENKEHGENIDNNKDLKEDEVAINTDLDYEGKLFIKEYDTSVKSDSKLKKPDFDMKQIGEKDNFEEAPKNLEFLEHTENAHEEKKPFCCDICNRKFTDSQDLNRHISLLHEGKGPYSCDICEHKFSTSTCLNIHITRVHDEIKPNKCDVCNKTFARRDNIKDHKARVHERKKPFKCDKCESCFAIPRDLKQHSEIVHEGIKPYSCIVCDIKFSQKLQLRQHITVMHVLKDKSIDESNVDEFKKDPDVAAVINQKLHKEYMCKLCDKKVLFGRSAHIRKYHNVENGDLKCPKCDKSFRKYDQLYKHVTDYHPKIEKLTPCKICGIMIAPKRKTRHFQMKHATNSEKQHQCKTCGKGFFSIQSFRDHMNTHTGEKPHLCKHCGAAFASQGTRNMHERTVHSGHSRYISEDQLEARNVDDKNTTRKKILNKKYSCLICSKTFIDTYKLNRHAKVHVKTGEPHGLTDIEALNEKSMNFICQICGKSFIDNWKLKRHGKVHIKAVELTPTLG